MHLKVSKRGQRQYLSIVQNYREGKKTKTKTLKSLGYADQYADQYADPVAHFRAYVEELNEKHARENEPVELTFSREEQIEPNDAGTVREGAAIALGYLDALGAHTFFQSLPDAPEHAGRIFEMLVCERIMHVESKRATWQRRGDFPRPCDFTFQEVYGALSCFAQNSARLITHLNRSYQQIRGPRETGVVYLVLGAFSFAVANDIDPARHIDKAGGGNASAGIGVVLDASGIPLTYRLMSAHPGAVEIDHATTRLRAALHARRVIVIAGRLPQRKRTMASLHAKGDGYVFYQPVRQSRSTLKAWITDDRGYVSNQAGTYKIKERLTHLDAFDNSGCIRRIPAKEVVLWGRDYTIRTRNARARQTESSASSWQNLAQEAQREPGSRPSAPTSGQVNPNLDGYVSVVSSETRLSAAAIFHLYREIWRLTEPFQVMEADFSPSPYPIPHADHVHAHFLICYTAFFALRLMRADMGWRYNAAQVADALLHMEGTHLQANWYLFSYRTPVSDAVEQTAGVDVARKLRTKADLRHIPVQVRERVANAGRER